MTSLACVAAGRLMLSDVALLAVPLLALTAPRNPMMIAPGQVSSTSHSFAAARQTAPALPGGCWQVVLAPSQVSVVQGSPSAGQAAPALPAGCVHVASVPLHTSAVQGLPSSVQDVVLGWKRSVGQPVLVPVQVSATSHPLTAARQTAPGLPAECWHEVLLPLQASPTPCRLTAARQPVAVLVFGGCWQATLVPSHWSSVQGLPSSVHAVPLAFRAPVSAGHVALVPVQVSGRSHSPAAARQTVPALPTGCWQVALVPLHWSRVQGLASSVQAAPALTKVQLFLQHEPGAPFNALPRSHCSPVSMVPLPQLPGASVNVICSVSPDELPVAVSVNVTPMSKTSTLKSVFVKSPFASATAVSWRSESISGSSCRTRTTVSPGSQPEPVMTTVSPGA